MLHFNISQKLTIVTICPHLSAPNPPNVMLRKSAVDQRCPPVQLQGILRANVLLPRQRTSSWTVQFVLEQ